MCATRFLRISAANIGPNRFHQNRTVSWLISNPALGQEILDVAQRQRVSHVHHHDQTNDLQRAVKYRNGLPMV
jgi:fatty acid desaturase